jgi:hypothetical protein
MAEDLVSYALLASMLVEWKLQNAVLSYPYYDIVQMEFQC